MAELISTVPALRNALKPVREARRSIGFVPTMGALHAGHRHLLDRAREDTNAVVTSIFVNPTQFDRKDDLERYPRALEKDLAVCGDSGVDFVFAPSAEEMYPQTQLTWVEVPNLEKHLCGPGRPGHFRGVATVVLKLLNVVQPDRAYFGEKDAQQLAIIRRMVADLNVPVTIVPVETVREPDGLAMSSRNQLLSSEDRQKATVLSEALFNSRGQIRAGERNANVLIASARDILSRVQVEYFSIVDPDTLEPVQRINNRVLIAGAIWLGGVRLIDNVFARQ